MPARRSAKPRPAKTLIGGLTDRARIRELFVNRKPFYGVGEILRLTHTREAELTAAANDGVVTALLETDGPRFSWEDVAHLALRQWTPRMIDGALDIVHREVVPVLNRVKQIDVQLPLYQIRLLHVLAEMRGAGFRGRLNASDILEHELLEFAVSVDADEIEAEIPGFRAAIHYPYFIQRENDWVTAFCRFCGRLSSVAGREICDDCKQRHEPRMHLGEHGVPELDREDE